ncbi:MAG TPA: hypothetical protein VK002_14730 [Rubricoccaceae bacterium]|nr:hypothetical protein [Rubricoccaceae bacterium]
MAKHTPDNPAHREPDADTANPHRAEPAPPTEEGLRPEADPAVVRPMEDEPLGPAQGLFHAAGTQAAHEAPVGTPEADAEAAYLGVEEEGVESSQIFGLLLATVAAIACLILALYFIFYLPRLGETEAAAQDVPEARRVEQREVNAAAENLLGQYAVSPDAAGRYRIPIAAAMQQTAAAYAGRGDSALAGPASRADFNVAWVTLHAPPAVASAADAGTALPSEGDLPGAGASTAAPAVEEGASPAPSNPTPAPAEQ